jgi:histidinol-phosphate aminotransferase
MGAPVRSVPVLASGSLDLGGMAAQAEGAGLFFVCNPNNPTGGVSTAEAITDFVARVRRVAPEAVLLMDEAYHDYVDDPGYASAIALVRSDPRILVSRTFSKIYGMAGMRVGYAVAQPATLGALRRGLSQGALSNVSVGAALASLADRDHHARQRTLNREAKTFTRKAFEDAGFRVLPSEANFVMVDVRRHAGSFAAACRDVGVFIARPFPPLDRHARVTIGTMDDMQRAMAAMLPILASPSSARRDEIAWDTAGC